MLWRAAVYPQAKTHQMLFLPNMQSEAARAPARPPEKWKKSHAKKILYLLALLSQSLLSAPHAVFPHGTLHYHAALPSCRSHHFERILKQFQTPFFWYLSFPKGGRHVRYKKAIPSQSGEGALARIFDLISMPICRAQCLSGSFHKCLRFALVSVVPESSTQESAKKHRRGHIRTKRSLS